MLQVVEEMKKNKLCMLFWNEEIEYKLNQPMELSYESVGEMGVYSKEYFFFLPYKGNDDRFKGMDAVLKVKITSLEKECEVKAGAKNDNCYYNLTLEVRKNTKERILSMRAQLFNFVEPEYTGTESVLRLFLINR